MYQGPITYQGNKRRLMPQIKPILDQVQPEIFFDLFCGSGTVGLNSNASKVIYNDKDKRVVELLDFIAAHKYEDLEAHVECFIDAYHLSDRYNGTRIPEEGQRLQDFNEAAYGLLRDAYNSEPGPIKLLVLNLFAFNRSLRFNSKGEFNLPVGDGDFNANARKKLKDCIERVSQQDTKFFSWDFREWVNFQSKRDLFWYADPPYSITQATYNSGWGEQDDKELLFFLNVRDRLGDKFALSNVLEAKGLRNETLISWLEDNPKYKVHDLNMNYSNANYQRKNKDSFTREVLITNY